MRGNSHVRFLEGKAVVIPLTYSNARLKKDVLGDT
jgi:hypothetical protein